MRIHLLPFGVLKDLLGKGPFDVPDGASVADLLALLRAQLGGQSPSAQLLSSIAVSVNAEYAQPFHRLGEGDQVGLLPPVSGGSGDQAVGVASPVLTYLTREVIPADTLVSAAKHGSDGAVVVFDGIVRDNTRGRRTLHLDYEAYEEMASRQMVEVSEQAISRYAIRHVTLVHRLGRLAIGETSVLIIVASAHRGVAFDACRWIIDTLKKTVPIWKKETFVDGAVWADGEPFPPELVANPVPGKAEPTA